jgi:hypothetical protein
MDAEGGWLLGLAVLVWAATVVAAARVVGARRAAWLAGLWACWLAGVMGLASVGYLQDFSVFPPRLLRAVVVTTLLSVSWMMRTPLERWRMLPLAVPVALHTYRLPLEVLLHRLHAVGVVPVQMTWEGTNLDVVTGVTAPLVALAVWRGWVGARAVLAWNALGLALLVNVVSIALRSFPGPLRTFMEEPGLAIMTTAPYVLVPAMMVPTAAAWHAASIRQAWAAWREAERQGSPW